MPRRTIDLSDAIDLAKVEPFHLGVLEILPLTRQVRCGDRSVTLEPRVMLVLVALAQAKGDVLTRDELIDLCWNGVIVGENAIQRAISRIRELAVSLGGGSIELETITKVGYRMHVRGAVSVEPAAPPAPPAEAPAPAPSRRLFLAGAALIAVTGGAGAWWWNRAPAEGSASPEAVDLFRRAQIAQRQAVPGQARQVVAYLEQAVEADPLFAEAWGALAIATVHILDMEPEGRELALAQMARSAARRALALDAGNADAQAALLFVNPIFRNWSAYERRLRLLLERHSDHWLLRMHVGLLLYQVGRWSDGIEHSRKLLEMDSFLPMANAILSRALWSAGRLHEANSVLDAALTRWPHYFMLWNMKYSLLAFTGQSEAAIAFLAGPDRPSEGLSPTAIADRIVLARAIEGRERADVAAVLSKYRGIALAQIEAAPLAAPIFAAVGDPDLAFAAIEGYFFGRGSLAGARLVAIGPFTRRSTDFLFTPPMAPLWPDPRFGVLTSALGLENYWRASGSRPDYRAQR